MFQQTLYIHDNKILRPHLPAQNVKAEQREREGPRKCNCNTGECLSVIEYSK